MNVKNHLWYPYLAYQKRCKERGVEDTITDFLIICGKIDPPRPPAVKEEKDEVKVVPKKVKTQSKTKRQAPKPAWGKKK